MEEDIKELYEELLLLCKHEECSLQDYRILRGSFERIVREKMGFVGLQATDLAAKINYLSNSVGWDNKMRNALHTFRLTSNDVLNHRKEPDKEEFLRDVRSVARMYSCLFDFPFKNSNAKAINVFGCSRTFFVNFHPWFVSISIVFHFCIFCEK